jgi:hypothetical protein
MKTGNISDLYNSISERALWSDMNGASRLKGSGLNAFRRVPTGAATRVLDGWSATSEPTPQLRAILTPSALQYCYDSIGSGSNVFRCALM